MEKARYGEDGPLVTLPEFIERQGGQTNSKKWTVKTCCPDCGGSTHPHDVKGALGFRTAARQVDGIFVPRFPGFHHNNRTAANDCPQNFSNDPRFNDLRVHSGGFDGRAKDFVLEALSAPKVVKANKRLLAMMMHTLEGAEPKTDSIERIEASARKKLATMQVLGTHPWLLPYIAARLEGHVRRVSDRGRAYKVTFCERGGRQSLEFIDVDGEKRNATFPSRLEACFVNGSPSKRAYAPMARGRVTFEISRQASLALLGFVAQPVEVISASSSPAHQPQPKHPQGILPILR